MGNDSGEDAYQDALIDEMGQRQPVEHLGEHLDHIHGILGLDLALEAVHLIHVLRLVVACQYRSMRPASRPISAVLPRAM